MAYSQLNETGFNVLYFALECGLSQTEVFFIGCCVILFLCTGSERFIAMIV